MQAEAGSRHSWRCWTWHMEGHDLPADAWCIAVSGVLFTMPSCPSRSQLQATGYIWVKGLLVDDLWMDKRLLHFRKSSKSSKYLFSKDILRSEQPWICTWQSTLLKNVLEMLSWISCSQDFLWIKGPMWQCFARVLIYLILTMKHLAQVCPGTHVGAANSLWYH